MRIETERLALRPLEINDLYTVHEYASDIENTEYMLYLPNRALDDTRRFLSRAILECEKENPAFYEFAITLDGKHIGAVSLYLDAPNNEGELGWILSKKYWGNGYALEAALAVKEFAFDTLGLGKLVAHCDSRNTASEKLMRRIGLQVESRDGIRKYPDARGSAGEYKYSLRRTSSV